MAAHTSTQNTDVSLALEFQKHLSNASRKHGVLDQRKDKISPRKRLDKQRVSYET